MLYFHLLGKLRILCDGQELPPPPYPSQPLLALLLLRPQIQQRQHLAEILFPYKSPEMGRRRLSDSLYELRRACPFLPIRSERHAICLESAECWLDVATFRAQSLRSSRSTCTSSPP